MLVDGKRTESLGAGQCRQILLLLRRRAPALDGIGRQRMVNDNGGDRRATAREVFDHFHKAHEAGFGSTEFGGKKQAEEILLRHFLHHVSGKFALFVKLRRDRVEILLGEIPSVPADQFLFFRKMNAHYLPAFCAVAMAAGGGASTAREITSRWIWLVPS